jgi:hypothetical protein
MHRCLTVPAPTLRLWVHCSRASDGLLPPRPYLVGCARWDARSDRFLLARQSFQQLFSSQCSLYAGSVVLPMTEDLETSVPPAVRAPSIFRSLVITTLSRVCIMLTMLPNPSPDPDRCSQIHRCLAVPVPTFRLRDSLSVALHNRSLPSCYGN